MVQCQDCIFYTFDFGERQVSFEINTVETELEPSVKDLPEWALQDDRKCLNCVSSSEEDIICAIAMRVEEVIQAFGSNVSTELVHVRVQTPQRVFSRVCDLQTGIHSLLGLLMATCGCSHMESMRKLVNFHIPFCSTKETLRRVVGAHLMEQYFVMRDGGQPDWALERLSEIFSHLAQLNQNFARRLQGTMEKDAVTNAILGFFATTSLFSANLSGEMDRQRAYLLNEPLVD